ncbi:serine/threonine protein kinase [Streptomyces sp. NBC_01186]|uniref:serine/threonine-protein kinase n=1 Tax=Streptomyces sp. NBC_01186 TaxID=2903765 RepID=UPI002E11A8C4|nr:serine/threonine protein kinase [Streptomyces sp. NBC_01186]
MYAVRAGTVLGSRYELDHPLGRGSMGHVWRGRDLHLGRPVAVKTVLTDADAHTDPREREHLRRRFEREARAAAGLDSANVATVHDADVTGEVRWLVMQLVDGATLGTVLGERDRLDVPSAVSVAAQVCSGLTAAHAAGLVHRDLKPENIMIRRDGVVKILDFGLVKLMTDAGSRLTTGQQPGNLLYASPELLSGSPPLDGRSDLYSVGCLLYHLLVGNPPFSSRQSMAVVNGHLNGTPAPLDAHRKDIPEGLHTLVHSLLAKYREQRPDSAAVVYGVLRAWLPRLSTEAADLSGFQPEDPRRPFVLPQGPYPV